MFVFACSCLCSDIVVVIWRMKLNFIFIGSFFAHTSRQISFLLYVFVIQKFYVYFNCTENVFYCCFICIEFCMIEILYYKFTYVIIYQSSFMINSWLWFEVHRIPLEPSCTFDSLNLMPICPWYGLRHIESCRFQ